MHEFQLFDGVKVINPNAFPEESWTVLVGDEEGSGSELKTLYLSVGYLYRCVDIRANTLSALPWQVTNKGGETIWENDSEEIPKQFAGLADLVELVYLTEAALCLESHAYWLKVGFPTRPQVRWLMPASIKEKWDKVDGLVGFERRVDAKMTEGESFDLTQIVHFGIPNPLHETKHNGSPANSALADARVISYLDRFAADFFKRGAVKTTLITVDRSVPQKQRQELKAWYQKVVKGIKTAWDTVVLSSDVKTNV